jgi:hypothetical protein
LWLPKEGETRRLAEEVVQALSEDEEEGEGDSRTGGGHRRGKKRTHKSYYEMTEKERFVYIRRCLSWILNSLVVWTGRLYSVGKEEGEGGSRTGGGHRRGKKRTHKSYYEMKEKERFEHIIKCLYWTLNSLVW